MDFFNVRSAVIHCGIEEARDKADDEPKELFAQDKKEQGDKSADG